MVVGNGNDVLSYWGLTLSVAEVVAVLCLFLAIFHVGSYASLHFLHRLSK